MSSAAILAVRDVYPGVDVFATVSISRPVGRITCSFVKQWGPVSLGAMFACLLQGYVYVSATPLTWSVKNRG
jgi:hypothetical protein